MTDQNTNQKPRSRLDRALDEMAAWMDARPATPNGPQISRLIAEAQAKRRLH